MPVRVQQEDFDLGQEISLFRTTHSNVGAVVSFLGTVRDLNNDQLISSMELEYYPGMTEKSLEEIIHAAKRRWIIFDALIIHRYGILYPNDQIVLVAVSSQHRGEAFLACEFIMDFLKTQAPFWKKEMTSSGGKWVDARESDKKSLTRWQ